MNVRKHLFFAFSLFCITPSIHTMIRCSSRIIPARLSQSAVSTSTSQSLSCSLHMSRNFSRKIAQQKHDAALLKAVGSFNTATTEKLLQQGISRNCLDAAREIARSYNNTKILRLLAEYEQRCTATPQQTTDKSTE